MPSIPLTRSLVHQASWWIAFNETAIRVVVWGQPRSPSSQWKLPFLWEPGREPGKFRSVSPLSLFLRYKICQDEKAPEKRDRKEKAGQGKDCTPKAGRHRNPCTSKFWWWNCAESRRYNSVIYEPTVFVTSASGAHMFAFAGLSGRLSLESGLRAVSECKIEFACVVIEPSILQGRPLHCIAWLFRWWATFCRENPFLLSCPVLRDRAIHSSTHGPINAATPSRVPSYVSIINIASSCHYSVTIDFPPTRRYFEHNPDLAARLARWDVQGVYRARPVGMPVPGK